MRIGLILVVLGPATLALMARAGARRAVRLAAVRIACPCCSTAWSAGCSGVRVDAGGRAIARHGPLLVVSNHTSWLDITVISTLAPLSFVAKSEVAGWPLFGTFARLQRSIFIDRTRRKGAAEANREIAERLAGGDAIVLFAEGTTSDGNRVLPFRSAVVGAARDAIARGGPYRATWSCSR